MFDKLTNLKVRYVNKHNIEKVLLYLDPLLRRLETGSGLAWRRLKEKSMEMKVIYFESFM